MRGKVQRYVSFAIHFLEKKLYQTTPYTTKATLPFHRFMGKNLKTISFEYPTMLDVALNFSILHFEVHGLEVQRCIITIIKKIVIPNAAIWIPCFTRKMQSCVWFDSWPKIDLQNMSRRKELKLHISRKNRLCRTPLHFPILAWCKSLSIINRSPRCADGPSAKFWKPSTRHATFSLKMFISLTIYFL